MQLFLVDNLSSVYSSVSGKAESLFRNYQNVIDALRDRKQYKIYIVALLFPNFFFCLFVPPLCLTCWLTDGT